MTTAYQVLTVADDVHVYNYENKYRNNKMKSYVMMFCWLLWFHIPVHHFFYCEHMHIT